MEQQPKSTLKRDSLWVLAGQGTAIVFRAAYFVFIGRALGSHEYGAFGGVASLTGILSQFSSLGMEVIIRDVSRDKSKLPSSWGLTLEISMIGYMVVGAFAMVLGHFMLPANVRMLIPFIVLSDVLFARIATPCGKAFQGFNNFAYSAVIVVFTNFTRTVAAGGLYFHVLRAHTLSNAYTWTRIYWSASLAVAMAGLVLVSLRLGLPTWKRPAWHIISEV